MFNNIKTIYDYHLDSTQRSQVETLYPHLNVNRSDVCENEITGIVLGKEYDFLTSLNAIDNYFKQIPKPIIPNALTTLLTTNNTIINNIKKLLLDNKIIYLNDKNETVNSELPFELRRLLGRIWCNCKIVNTNADSNFKDYYQSVTYYSEFNSFILNKRHIGTQNKTSEEIFARDLYLHKIDILEEKVKLKQMSDYEKNIILYDIDRLKTYLASGNMPADPPTTPPPTTAAPTRAAVVAAASSGQASSSVRSVAAAATPVWPPKISGYTSYANRDQNGQTIDSYPISKLSTCIQKCNSLKNSRDPRYRCKGMVVSKDTCWMIKGAPSSYTRTGSVMYKNN